MTPPNIPDHARLDRRWRQERVLSWVVPVICAVICVLALIAGALFFWSAGLDGIRVLLAGVLLAWVGGLVVLFARFCRRPPAHLLAKRADHVLGLPDDLLSLLELPENAATDWKTASRRRTAERLSSISLIQAWPLGLAWSAWGVLVGAFLLTAGVIWLGNFRLDEEMARLARLEAARDVRVAAAREVLQDWKDFVDQTDDEELKKLFADAGKLQEAVENKDPMAAMLEMNRIEEKMTALEEAIAKDSLSAQAGEMAEALEAFEGMGAMSAALRNQNFGSAAHEAEKLAAKLAADPDGRAAVRREEAVSEMLATQSSAAAQRGNQNLSEALSKMSQAASQAKKDGSAPNGQLATPTKSLQNQFSQESSRQNRGRAAALTKNQLNSLRRSMRGEQPVECQSQPSLCKACLGSKPGGKNAGSSTTGSPQDESTELAAAGVQENVTGTQGDGESETKTLSSATGSGSTAGSARPSKFSDYAELSQKAVADENLPLAHRRVIQSYFERIRPVAETKLP